jgi:membrane-associated phospholipid phosphatase
VAAYCFAHRGARWVFQGMAAPSLLALPVASVVLGFAVARRLAGRAPPSRVLVCASVATLAATAAKDELKWIFGRPWPETFERYGVYAFHPFTTGWQFGGFPSGHTAYITAPMCVLWQLAPRWRVAWGGLIAMVMTGLVGAGYHFPADVVAGFFTGLAAAVCSLVLLRDA